METLVEDSVIPSETPWELCKYIQEQEYSELFYLPPG